MNEVFKGRIEKKLKTLSFYEPEANEGLHARKDLDLLRDNQNPDDLKLRSSMTLFAEASSDEDVFRRVLDKFFDGKKDTRTLAILRQIGE